MRDHRYRKTALGLLALCLVGCTTVNGARPGWVVTLGRDLDFPAAEFVTGFGMSPEDKSMPTVEKLAYARNMAYRNLSEVLRVEISSEDRIHRLSTMVGNDEELLEEFKSTVVAKSDINLDGVQFQEHTGRSSEACFALAYLNRSAAREHYKAKFVAKMRQLNELQKEANAQLLKQNIRLARTLFLECEVLVYEIEEIIGVRQLLGDATPVAESDLQTVARVRSKSQELWEKTADTMQEAAELLALKLTAQSPPAGRVQVNALMLDDSYQYSQFSSRFRGILETELPKVTELRPLLAGEMDFTPHSVGIARSRLAANGADLLLSGSYFMKDDDQLVRILVRLSDAKTSAIIATADASMKIEGAQGLEMKPRNYLNVLEDRKVFSKDQIVGGALDLQVWSNKGREGLLLEDGDELNLYVRVNRPCYIRFMYHLSNGARVVPDELYMNYYINTEMVNRPVKLPHDFTICAPFGSETMQFIASTEKLPPIQTVTKSFEGEAYEVLADSLEQSNQRHRGLKVKKKVEVTERRISLTTVKK